MMAMSNTPFLVRAIRDPEQRRLAEYWKLRAMFDGKSADRYFEWMADTECALRELLKYPPSSGQLQKMAEAALPEDDGFQVYLLNKGLSDFGKESLGPLASATASILVTMFRERGDDVEGAAPHGA